MPSLQSLPSELLLLICNFCDQKTLLKLSSISHRLNFWANRCLFHRIRLRLGLPERFVGAGQESMVNAIIRGPRLAMHIQRLDVKVMTIWEYIEPWRVEKLRELLYRLLPVLSNLKSLYLLTPCVPMTGFPWDCENVRRLEILHLRLPKIDFRELATLILLPNLKALKTFFHCQGSVSSHNDRVPDLRNQCNPSLEKLELMCHIPERHIEELLRLTSGLRSLTCFTPRSPAFKTQSPQDGLLPTTPPLSPANISECLRPVCHTLRAFQMSDSRVVRWPEHDGTLFDLGTFKSLEILELPDHFKLRISDYRYSLPRVSVSFT